MKPLRLLALLLLLPTLAIAATQYTPGPWLLFISGTQQPGEYASAADCDIAVHKINAPPNVTVGCRQSTKLKAVNSPPPPVDCVTMPMGDWVDGMSSSCVNGTQTVSQTRALMVTTQPANGGKACPDPLSESRTVVRSCSTPPPPSNLPPPAVPYTNERVKPYACGPGLGECPNPAADGVGAFRVSALYSHMGPDDPIVFPGKPGASHIHTFFANACTDAFSTTQSLFACTGSTSNGGILNKSSYWVPCLQAADGKCIVPVENMVYYKKGYNQVPAASIINPPNGLRFVFGELPTNDKILPNWQRHHNWSCNQVATPGVDDQIIPPCASGFLFLAIDAMNCWDGINLDSADHRSHMAYSGGGACPADHPVAIPVITFNIKWPVPVGGTTGAHLSSDMYPGSGKGLSAHGDVWVNWKEDIKDAFMTNCVRKSFDCHGALLGDGRTLY